MLELPRGVSAGSIATSRRVVVDLIVSIDVVYFVVLGD